ncbi:MAG TPA: response regulator [Pyrinomonadaceae bacterium]|nr:response regulator [Pyrinomonadaceae bacterium]
MSYVLNKTTTLAPQQQQQSGARVAPETDERRILIVDDEDSARHLFADCLSSRYLCTTAANAEEAFAHLSRESYALVLTDVNMPGLSGIELLRQIVVRYPDTAVIIISAIDRTQRVLDAVHLGAFNYLIKPCDLDVLELCVERALQRRALLRDGRRYKQDLERRNAELAHRKAELERLQAQIVHSEKMASLGQLAAGVAHELNNPANFIYGNMELLVESVCGIERLMTVYDALALPPAV